MLTSKGGMRMKASFLSVICAILVTGTYCVLVPANAYAEQGGTERAERQLLLATDFDKCLGLGCLTNRQLDKLEDQLEISIRQAKLFEQLLPEGTPLEEAVDRIIADLENELAQLEKVLSESK
jgi:hypothetical protein